MCPSGGESMMAENKMPTSPVVASCSFNFILATRKKKKKKKKSMMTEEEEGYSTHSVQRNCQNKKSHCYAVFLWATVGFCVTCSATYGTSDNWNDSGRLCLCKDCSKSEDFQRTRSTIFDHQTTEAQVNLHWANQQKTYGVSLKKFLLPARPICHSRPLRRYTAQSLA